MRPVDRSSSHKKHSQKPEEPTEKRILVIGGTHFIGKLLVGELLKLGHEIHILHRKQRQPFGKRVHNLVGDRNNAASVRKAVGAIRFDVVFDTAYDWERGTSGAEVTETAQIFDGKVSRYIFMSSVSAYGDGLNHHEGDALAPDDHPNAYARNKAMSERALFRLHQRTGFPITTLRPPFVYGAGNPFYREAFFWDRFRAGRQVIVPSEGHRLMQFIYVKDLVELALRAMELRSTVGHAFNTATYLVNDPSLGWIAFGGNIVKKNETITVTALDSFRNRLYIAPFGLWLTLDAGKFEQAVFDPHNGTVRLTLDGASEFTPQARLRIEQPGKLAGVGSYHPAEELKQKRGAFTVPLKQDATEIVLQPSH